MLVITVRNVHEALPEGLRALQIYGEKRDTRNGAAYVIPQPVTTLFTCPRERVLFWRERDANPFFHFFESLWMLAGRNDLAFVQQFVKQMAAYSDDGRTLHGAYGYRWRNMFDGDQLEHIILLLKNSSNTRRAVLQMYNAEWDSLHSDEAEMSKDIPCNTQAYFWIETGHLHMTVTNRSNDIVWGLYGANAVHFSVLQEFIATAVGIPVGKYWHVSNNFHIYEEMMEKYGHLVDSARDPYRTVGTNPYIYMKEDCRPHALMTSGDWRQWLRDVWEFVDSPVPSRVYRDVFFNSVAEPLYLAHRAYKEKDYAAADDHVEKCKAGDWRLACSQWLNRRRDLREYAADDGVPHG